MTEALGLRARGRPKGAKNRAKEGLGRGRLRDALADSLTQKDVDRLPPKAKADLLVKLEPKERPAEDRASTFTLVISGLHGKEPCPNCGWKLSPADPGPRAHGDDLPSDRPPSAAERNKAGRLCEASEFCACEGGEGV